MTTNRPTLWLEEPSYFGAVGVCSACGYQCGPWPDLDDGEAHLLAHWRAHHGQADQGGRAPVVVREGEYPACSTPGCYRPVKHPSTGECRPCYRRRRHAEGRSR